MTTSEIEAVLNEMFPGENNSRLAEAISKEIE